MRRGNASLTNDYSFTIIVRVPRLTTQRIDETDRDRAGEPARSPNASILQGLATSLVPAPLWHAEVERMSQAGICKSNPLQAFSNKAGILIVLTGIAVIEQIREACGKALPAMIITADHSPALVELARRHGHQLLKKPLKPAKLRALMSHLLGQRGSRTDRRLSCSPAM